MVESEKISRIKKSLIRMVARSIAYIVIKMAKRGPRPRMAAHAGFNDIAEHDTPFDLDGGDKLDQNKSENLDQRMVAVVCKEMIKMFNGKGVAMHSFDPGQSSCVNFAGPYQ